MTGRLHLRYEYRPSTKWYFITEAAYNSMAVFVWHEQAHESVAQFTIRILQHVLTLRLYQCSSLDVTVVHNLII